MAIGVIFEFPGMTREQYEATSKKVWKGPGNKLADWPVEGVLAHMAGPMPKGWCVVEFGNPRRRSHDSERCWDRS